MLSGAYLSSRGPTGGFGTTQALSHDRLGLPPQFPQECMHVVTCHIHCGVLELLVGDFKKRGVFCGDPEAVVRGAKDIAPQPCGHHTPPHVLTLAAQNHLVSFKCMLGLICGCAGILGMEGGGAGDLNLQSSFTTTRSVLCLVSDTNVQVSPWAEIPYKD